MKTKRVMKVVAILAVGVFSAFNIVRSTKTQECVNFSDVMLANLEALSEESSGEKGNSGETFQIATVEEVVADGGWTFDAGLNVWLLNGKVQHTSPSHSRKITYKCCRPQGDVTDCKFERC